MVVVVKTGCVEPLVTDEVCRARSTMLMTVKKMRRLSLTTVTIEGMSRTRS